MTTHAVVYRKGNSHLDKGTVVIKTSTDGGATWGSAVTVLSDATYDIRDPGIVRLSSGNLVCSLWKATVSTLALIDDGAGVVISTDGGASWGSFIALGDSFTAGSACCAPPVVLASGSLILPFYGGNTGYSYRSARAMFSADGGATWSGEVTIANGPGDSKDYSEPNIVRLANGSLLCLIRMDTGTDTIHQSISTDGGSTWSAPAAAFAGSGAPHVIQLASGKLVCCYRSSTGSKPVLRTSIDNGATWSSEYLIDNSAMALMTYASPLEKTAGTIAIAYAVQWGASNRGAVRYVEIAESEL